MNKNLKNMIFLSVLIAATVGSAMRAADNADNKDNKEIKNVIEKQPAVQKKGSLWNPMNWFYKQPVVKPVEVKPVPAPKKPKFLVPLIKSFAKRTLYSGVAAAGCYWFANSTAPESLLRMGGHDAPASRIADPLTKTLVGAVAGAVIYRQASQFKREFVDRGTECFVDKMLGKVVDNEKFGPWTEKCIGGGVDNALERPNVKQQLNDAVNAGIANNIGKLNVALINKSGASSEQVEQLEKKIGKRLEEQKSEQDMFNQQLLAQNARMLELLDRKPLYMRVWNWVFKKRGSSKKPVNPSVMPGSGTPTSTDTTKPEDKNQPSKIKKE